QQPQYPPQQTQPAGYPPQQAAAYGPQSQTPDPAVTTYITPIYDSIAASGRIDSNEVIKICQAYNITCDQATAAQILTAAAGPQKNVTKDLFVFHVSLYITRNRKY
ncbi:MAG: hypothetical protein EZS28_038560, partial [Streblomastix strix]